MSDAKPYWETMQDKETKKGFMTVPDCFEEAKKEIHDLVSKTKSGLSETYTIEVDGKYAGNVKLDYQNNNINSDEGRVHLWIHPDFRGRGLATKSLSALVEYAFHEKKFRIIYAQSKESNEAITKVLEKTGFKLEKVKIVEGIRKNWWSLKK